MGTLASSLGAKHRFFTVYAPWSNGTVESVCKEGLRVIACIQFGGLSLRKHTQYLPEPYSVPAIQSIINNSPSRRLRGRAPITSHTGMTTGNPVTVAMTNCNIQGMETIEQAGILWTRRTRM